MAMSLSTMVRGAMGHLRDPLYLNAYALMASNLLSSAIGLVYWAMAARLYPVEVVGISAAVISLIAFLSGLAQLNLRAALLRLVPEAGPESPRLVRNAYLVSGSISAGVGLLAFAGLGFLGTEPLRSLQGGPGISLPAVLLLSGATLFWSIFNLQDGVLAGMRRTIWVPLENVLYSLAKLLALVALVVALPLYGILVSWFVPVIAAVIVVSLVLALRWLPAHVRAGAGTTRPDTVLIGRHGRLMRYLASDYAASLFALATGALLPVLIAARRGPAEGAYFYLVWIVAVSLDLLPINLSASMTVETSSGRADLVVETRRVLKHTARLVAPLALLVALLAPWLLRIFGDEYSERGSDLLRLLALSVIPFGIIATSLAVARVRGRSRELVIIQGSLATLTLGGSALLLGPLGITGVGLALLGARLAVAAVLLLVRLRPLLAARG